MNNFKVKISFLILVGIFLFPFSIFAAWKIDPEFISPEISNVSIEPNQTEPNQTIIIKTKVIDDSPIVSVKANLSNLGTIFLDNDGTYQDENKYGGIYTAQWTISEGTNLGEYIVEIIAMDIWENTAIDNSGKFEVVSSSDFSPEKYAPNLWFDSDESYYPIDPFFYVDSTNDIDDIDEISGEASQNNYFALPDDDKEKNKFTVFYHVAETEDKTQWVYEYFFYYAYNKMPRLNEHYHDWEAVFVFVNKKTEKVKRVVASAHGKWANNNEYLNSDFNLGKHVGIMIEGGSHANCIDRNNDGLFQWETDITNGPFPFAWGIFNRNVEDKEYGYQIQSETYLPNLIEITDNFISKFKNYKSFPNSPTFRI